MSSGAPTQADASPHPCGAVFATQAWQQAWEQATIEPAQATAQVGPQAVPLRLVTGSPFWRGYELDAGGQRTWTGPVAYLSTVYAFSNPLNRSTGRQVQETLQPALEQMNRWEATALAVPNLEPGPVLQALTEAKEHPAPDALVRLDVTSRLELTADFDTYLGSLSHSRRSQFRRKHRRAAENGVTYHCWTGPAALERVEEYVALTDASAMKHDIEPLYDAATLRAMLSVPGGRLLTSEREGVFLAGLLSFAHEDTLILWSGGMRYDVPKDFYPYVFLLYELLQDAADSGVRFVDFGRGNPSFKGQYGFGATDLWTAVYLRPVPGSQDLRARLEAMHRGISEFLELPA